MSPTIVALIGAAACLVGLVSIACAVVLVRRMRREHEAALATAIAERVELTARIEELGARMAPTAAPEFESVPVVEASSIVLRPEAPVEDAAAAGLSGHVLPGRIDGRLFADLLVRESVVRTAALAHGLRHALSPRVRHRIRFEMGLEVKRSRRQRKADMKVAMAQYKARQRAALRDVTTDGENVA